MSATCQPHTHKSIHCSPVCPLLSGIYPQGGDIDLKGALQLIEVSCFFTGQFVTCSLVLQGDVPPQHVPCAHTMSYSMEVI